MSIHPKQGHAIQKAIRGDDSDDEDQETKCIVTKETSIIYNVRSITTTMKKLHARSHDQTNQVAGTPPISAI